MTLFHPRFSRLQRNRQQTSQSGRDTAVKWREQWEIITACLPRREQLYARAVWMCCPTVTCSYPILSPPSLWLFLNNGVIFSRIGYWFFKNYLLQYFPRLSNSHYAQWDSSGILATPKTQRPINFCYAFTFLAEYWVGLLVRYRVGLLVRYRVGLLVRYRVLDCC